MLAPHEVDVVIELIVVGSDVSGAVTRVADRRIAGKGHNRKSVRSWIPGDFDSRNAKLRGKIESRVPILCIYEKPGPSKAGRIDGRRSKDMGFTQNGLMRRILSRSADHGSNQRHRKHTGLTNVVARLAVASKGIVGIGEAVIDFDVEGIFSHRT